MGRRDWERDDRVPPFQIRTCCTEKEAKLVALSSFIKESQAPKPHSYTDTALSPPCVQASANSRYLARERMVLWGGVA